MPRSFATSPPPGVSAKEFHDANNRPRKPRVHIDAPVLVPSVLPATATADARVTELTAEVENLRGINSGLTRRIENLEADLKATAAERDAMRSKIAALQQDPKVAAAKTPPKGRTQVTPEAPPAQAGSAPPPPPGTTSTTAGSSASQGDDEKPAQPPPKP